MNGVCVCFQEKDVQASVAEVLGAVKQKTSEVKDLLAMVEALKELREVRRETSRKKGNGRVQADKKTLSCPNISLQNDLCSCL